MEKKEIISKYQKSQNDTGSTGVQIALKTELIKDLSAHVKVHKKDHHTTRGLIKAVEQRKKLIKYLKRKNPEEYKTVIESLGLRK